MSMSSREHQLPSQKKERAGAWNEFPALYSLPMTPWLACLTGNVGYTDPLDQIVRDLDGIGVTIGPCVDVVREVVPHDPLTIRKAGDIPLPVRCPMQEFRRLPHLAGGREPCPLR